MYAPFFVLAYFSSTVQAKSFDTPSHSMRYIIYFHDYLHRRFSLKSSKLWMNTYVIMYLTKKCEITENMSSYILDFSK